MRLGKSKTEPERQRQRSGARPTHNSAFSYYATRSPEKPERNAAAVLPRRSVSQQEAAVVRPRYASRRFLSALPFWIILVVVAVCAIKLLSLSSNPRVVIVGQQANASYVQLASVYGAAAQKLLSANKANGLKLTADVSGVSASLRQEFPELEGVSITVPLVGNRPIVYVMPSQSSLLLSTAGTNYVLNNSGVVLAKATTAAPKGGVVVTDQTGITPVIGKQLLPASTMAFISSVNYQLKAAHVSVSGMTLPQGSTYELDVQLAGKPYTVRMNLQADATQQAGALVAVLTKLGGTQPGQYIDLRVPERVYYK